MILFSLPFRAFKTCFWCITLRTFRVLSTGISYLPCPIRTSQSFCGRIACWISPMRWKWSQKGMSLSLAVLAIKTKARKPSLQFIHSQLHRALLSSILIILWVQLAKNWTIVCEWTWNLEAPALDCFPSAAGFSIFPWWRWSSCVWISFSGPVGFGRSLCFARTCWSTQKGASSFYWAGFAYLIKVECFPRG